MGKKIAKYFEHTWQLWIMLLPAMIYIFVFCYVPMYGVQLAFREYSFAKGFLGGDFVGFKYFLIMLCNICNDCIAALKGDLKSIFFLSVADFYRKMV